jgi:hypothetical protein
VSQANNMSVTTAAPITAAVPCADARTSVPWYIYSVLFASTSVIVGVLWDISWHQTIGRVVAGATLGDADGAARRSDPDDAWFAGQAIPENSSATFTGPDGMTITWQRGAPFVEGQERLLTFVAQNADGSPAELEPYMGMLGHAAVTNHDGSVFAHLHPSGSISMAALRKFEGAADPHVMHRTVSAGEVSIPYAFPKAGRYRVWIQMKRAGHVVTGAFDGEVK